MVNVTKIDTGTDQLLCELFENVALVTLNKPEKRNALGDIITPALRNTLKLLEANENVQVVIITGAGGAFCAGGDVKDMSSNEIVESSKDDQISELITKQNELTLRLFNLKKPTIAMISGPAAGAGFCIALACDLRVASTNSFFSTGYRNVGLPGDYGGTWLLTKLVGPTLAKKLYFSAEKIMAQKAFELGIITEVTPESELKNSTFLLAKMIATAPTTAIYNMKKNINYSMHSNLEDTLKMEAAATIHAINSDEHKVAVREFVNNRKNNRSKNFE